MNKPLKILMLAEYFPPYDRGGSEWSVFYLAKELVAKKHQVEIFTPNFGTERFEILQGIHIYRFPFYKHLETTSENITPLYFSNPFWFTLTFIFLLIRIIKYHPTHIHIQGKYFLPVAVIIGKICNIPIITTIRDYIILCPYGFCITKNTNYMACNLINLYRYDLPIFLSKYISLPSIIKYPIYYFVALYGWINSRILRYFLRKSAKIICISEKLSTIYKFNHIQVDRVIYNSINGQNISNVEPGNYILYVGRLTYGKGVDLLIKAYSLLKQTPKKLSLVIIGNGPLKKQINTLKINGLKLMGQMPYQNTLEMIKKAKLVIVPSVWEEPFGRVALEAQIMGIPVVVSDHGALQEIIIPNITGIVVEPTVNNLVEGISKAINNLSVYRRNLRLKHQYFENKFIDQPVKQYIRLYQNI